MPPRRLTLALLIVGQALLVAGARAEALGVIVTVAGGGSDTLGGGGPATSAKIDPASIALDSHGTLFIADLQNNRIRKVTPDGAMSTYAGTGGVSEGLSTLNDGGPAIGQPISPSGLTADNLGNLYVVDDFIEKIAPDGILTRVTGPGLLGRSSGDGGPAHDAALNYPGGLAVDSRNILYINEAVPGGHIRRVTPDGLIDSVPGPMSTRYYEASLASDRWDNLYYWSGEQVVRRSPDGVVTSIAGGGQGYPGDGGLALNARLGSGPIVLDSAGNLFLSDFHDQRVRKVSPDGILTTVAGIGPAGSEPLSGYFGGFSGDGGPAVAAQVNFPAALAIDAEGNLYIDDSSNGRVRKVFGVAAPGLVGGVPLPASGDMNHDGKVDLVDARLALESVVGLGTLTREQRAFADLDGDGVLNLYDVILLLRRAVGL